MTHIDTRPADHTAERAETRPWNAVSHGACGQWWTGTGRAHCAAPGCCRTFSCDSAADRHRAGPYGGGRRCLDPATVGLTAKPMPWGVMWSWPAPEPGRDTRRGAEA